MKNKHLIFERTQLMKIAGLIKEGKEPSYGGTDNIEEFEFSLDGKEYIANLLVNFYFDWDSEDGIYNYDQKIEVEELSAAVGDEYVPVTDQVEISKVENTLNTDPALFQRIEDLVDTWGAEESMWDADEYFDDLEEDSDYDMGTPSGDTDAMNIG